MREQPLETTLDDLEAYKEEAWPAQVGLGEMRDEEEGEARAEVDVDVGGAADSGWLTAAGGLERSDVVEQSTSALVDVEIADNAHYDESQFHERDDEPLQASTEERPAWFEQSTVAPSAPEEQPAEPSRRADDLLASANYGADRGFASIEPDNLRSGETMDNDVSVPISSTAPAAEDAPDRREFPPAASDGASGHVRAPMIHK